MYAYIKAKPSIKPWLIVQNRMKLKVRGQGFNWASGIFFAAGAILLANVAVPLFNYQFRSGVQFRQKLLVPVSEVKAQVLGEDLDDDQWAVSWFSDVPDLSSQPSQVTEYRLSVPKLKIKDALVKIGGDDLMESMVQYPGTALPGNYGNMVVFCHSSLPQFFNPENYKTICATLPEIEIGDEILIDYDGVNFRYQVTDLVEVNPDDMAVLAQYYDSQYLSMITCVPPGTYLRRLIVRARLT
jgi:sortase A